ncbi:MAG: universal stress protein [Planctomycetota bacterium]|nr:universal stress protein [Planctomycetota bacterium]
MSDTGSIVVGVDFSACSSAALSQAVRIGAWTTSPVHAVHVIDTMALADLEMAFATMLPTALDDFTREAQDAWKRLAETMPGTQHVAFEVVLSGPLHGIVQSCTKHHASMLVLGVHGESPHRGAGVLAGQAVRSAPADVLLVEEGKAGKFGTIVACIDFSETSRRALDRAVAFAAADGAQVIALHVYRAPWRGFHFRPSAAKDDPGAQARYRDLLLQKLEAFCQPGKDPPATWARPRFELVEHDKHGVGIAEFVRASGADLVVLGTRGRTNLRDVLLGSTAERVVREAPTSILAVRPAAG